MKSCAADADCLSSPVHLHVKSRTPVHLHILKKHHNKQLNDQYELGVRSDDVRSVKQAVSVRSVVEEEGEEGIQYNESCNIMRSGRRPLSRSAVRQYSAPGSANHHHTGRRSRTNHGGTSVQHNEPWIHPPGKSTCKTYSKAPWNIACHGECARDYNQHNCCCEREEMCLTRTREYEQKVCDLVAQVAYLKNKLQPVGTNDSSKDNSTALTEEDSKKTVESVLKRLQEVEIEGLDMVPQISALRDLICLISDPCHAISRHESQALLNQAQCLRDKLGAFEMSSERLRGLLCDSRLSFQSLVKSVDANKKEAERAAAEYQEKMKALEKQVEEQMDKCKALSETNTGENACMMNHIQSLEQQLLDEKFKNSTQANKEKDELKKALRTYKEKCAKYQEANEDMCGKLCSSESNITKLNNELRSKKNLIDKLNKDLQASQEDNSVNTRRVAELETLIERMAREAANDSLAAEAQLKNKHCHTEALTSENCRLQKCVSSSEEKLRQSELELAKLKGQLSDYELVIDNYRQQLQQQSELMVYSQESYAANTQLRESLNKLNLQVDALTRENISLQRQLSNCEEDRQTLHRRLIGVETEMCQYSRSPALASAAAAQETSQRRCFELEFELRQCQQELSAVSQQKSEIESSLRCQLSDMRERLEQSHQTNRSLQNYVMFLKSMSQVLNEPSASSAVARSSAHPTFVTAPARNTSSSGTLTGHASTP